MPVLNNEMAQWRRFVDFPRVPVIGWQKIVPNENPVQRQLIELKRVRRIVLRR
jgi:hypothetical protein